MSRLIKLPNNVVVNVDKILMVVRKEINEYNIIVEGAPVAPIIDGETLNLLVQHAGITVIDEPPRIQA